MVLVSVIIPTWHGKTELLRRAVDSVLAQTYENVEVVLVDDNGDAASASYRENARRLAESYGERVVYIQNTGNIGGALSRNHGIEHAKGDYITFLDDDDRYLPKKVENQLVYMQENGLDMCFTELRFCNYQDKTVDYREHLGLEGFDRKSLLRRHLMHHIIGTPTFMYKRKAIEKVGGFDDAKVSQEWYLMYKTIMTDGIKIGYYPHCDVVAYRNPTGGISGGPHKIAWEKKLYQFKKRHFDLLSKKEQRYVTFRFYAVLTAAAKRNRKYLLALGYLCRCFFTSPCNFFRELIHMAQKRRQYKFK